MDPTLYNLILSNIHYKRRVVVLPGEGAFTWDNNRWMRQNLEGTEIPGSYSEDDLARTVYPYVYQALLANNAVLERQEKPFAYYVEKVLAAFIRGTLPQKVRLS